MVSIRCSNFNDAIWTYVVEYARRKGISRCEALEKIVIEHMKVVAEATKKMYEQGENIV